MSLPPVDKLPLALRKSVRDDWDAKKGEIEAKLTEILGTEWTIDVDPKQVLAYATEERSYAKQNLGACIREYFDSASRRLAEFKDYYKEDGVNEINNIAHAHVMTLDIDLENRFSTSGCDVSEARLRLLFNPKYLASNISSCLDRDVLAKALNDAPGPENFPMSFAARTDIRMNFDPKIADIKARIGELVAKPDITLTPNFEDNFAKLLAESKVKKTNLRQDWQRSFGSMTREYFSGLAKQLEWQKFEDDELLQEGFNDLVSKGEVAFRIVDKLQKGSYNECVIEDGVLYLQTTPKTWASNTNEAAEKLIDLL
ncbi:hypothetical protein GGR55DRAFT_662736 [Xylaria sp. FL0064]|nr:hypothetical protein GGR55DRAFT_662736 [Xylaria sp. FL0064]